MSPPLQLLTHGALCCAVCCATDAPCYRFLFDMIPSVIALTTTPVAATTTPTSADTESAVVSSDDPQQRRSAVGVRAALVVASVLAHGMRGSGMEEGVV